MATYEGSCGKYTIILNVSEVSSSVDVSSNTSKVSWSLQFRADTAYCQWNPGPGDFEVKINGASVWSAQNPGLMFGGSGQTLTLASGTSGAITHNSDGAKTVSCQAIYTQNSTANYLPSSGSCSGNLKLSTIPRASSFSSITGNVIGESQTINIDRKSSNFTNNLWYRVGNEDWVSIGTEIDTSITWTLPTSLNNKIPNATSLTLTYLLRTYNGSTQIGGDVTYDFNVNYSGEKPTAGTATITYSKLFNNKFIANYSSGTINYSGYDGVYGSTVKNAQVVFNGSWKGTTSYSTGLLTAGTHTFQGVVTDSRENTSYTTQQSFTCYQINNPTVSINAYRSDSSGNANPSGTYITIIPTYSAHDPVGGNSIKSSSFTCTSLMTTGTAITSGSKKILSGATTDSQYVISGTVTDQLGRTSATSVQIGTAFALWDVRPDQRGMAFGKYSTGADKFEVAWDAYFDGKLNGYSTGVTDYGDSTKKIQIGFEDAGLTTSNLTHIAGYTDNGTKIKDVSKSVLQSWLGISDSDLLNKIYPIGAVYITYDNNNPGNFLGGTWVQFGQGRVLIGQGTGNDGSTSMSFTAGATIGKYKHTLSHSEIGRHNYGALLKQNGNEIGVHDHSESEATPFDLLQPSIVVYFWRRTA